MPENPDYPIPEGASNRVLNAQLKVGNTTLMISDTFPGPQEDSFQIGNHISIALIVNSVEKSRTVFSKLEADGNVSIPLHETFWSPSYGQVTDKFGVEWQVSTELDE